MVHEGDSDTQWYCCTWNNPQRIGKMIGRLRNKKTSEGNIDYSIIKIGKNIKKNRRDFRRLDVPQTPVRNH